MDFVEKINKIKTVSKLSVRKLGLKSGLESTLEKAYSDNREMKDSNTEKLLRNLGINPEWWNSGIGEVFTGAPPRNEKAAEEPQPPTLLQILLESVRGVNKLVDANNGLVDKLDKDKNWALAELEKLHAKLGITKES